MGCDLTIQIPENISNASALQWVFLTIGQHYVCEGEIFIKDRNMKLKGWDDLNTHGLCTCRSYIYVSIHAKLLT